MATLLALCAFMPVAHASVVIVDNLGNTFSGHTAKAQLLAQGFSPTAGGQISSITLQLDFAATGSLVVNLYSANASGQPLALIGALGTITATATGDNQHFTLTGGSLTSRSLAAGQNYDVVIAGTTSIGWDYTSSSANSGAGGAIVGKAWGDNGTSGVTWTQGAAYTGLELTTVPEPVTCALAGFGVIFIGVNVARALRRNGAPPKTLHKLT